ncbi:hypothetical protein K435DRAFT_866431 [Dendrothele bispora CBS 962.96]|uniref:Uncharacterized protein n=1 Tax=Dendrothele bispora (strain CBS 962.96) TaxID=1314807 RepID=A0A4S8LHN3_DENBC|nr:hypothetical protein K435DRAFT_866431 [Dendrothele bispora CBS 962.96]
MSGIEMSELTSVQKCQKTVLSVWRVAAVLVGEETRNDGSGSRRLDFCFQEELKDVGFGPDFTEKADSRGYQYFEVDETGVKHVVECFRLDTTPDPDVYAVGSTLFSTTDGTLSACRVGPVTERIDCMPIKILVKYLAPDEVWMLIGTLGSDKPFAKFLTKDVYYDKEWEEFCVQASLVRLEFGEQVERRHRFRIVVSPSDRPGFLDAVQFECQPPGVEWKRDWECAYDEFKNLDNSHFLFDRD